MASIPFPNLTGEDCSYLADLAKDANRYEDGITFLEHFITCCAIQGEDVWIDEAKLLADLYRTVHESLFESRKAIMKAEEDEDGEDNDHVLAARHYREEIDRQIRVLCERFISTLETHLIPRATSESMKVIFLNWLGDFHNHVAEVSDIKRCVAVEEAVLAYEQAKEAARVLKPGGYLKLTIRWSPTVLPKRHLNIDIAGRMQM